MSEERQEAWAAWMTAWARDESKPWPPDYQALWNAGVDWQAEQDKAEVARHLLRIADLTVEHDRLTDELRECEQAALGGQALVDSLRCEPQRLRAALRGLLEAWGSGNDNDEYRALTEAREALGEVAA